MEIKITKGENGETIIANDKICPGFYIADEYNTVEKNNAVAGIQFEPVTDRNGHQSRVSKYGEFAFVTTRADNEYLQHILAPAIDEDGFHAYVESLADYPAVQQMLFTAFALKGRLTLGK